MPPNVLLIGNPQWFCVRDGFLFYLFERTKCAGKKKKQAKMWREGERGGYREKQAGYQTWTSPICMDN